MSAPTVRGRILGWSLAVVGLLAGLYAGVVLAGSLWRPRPPNATWLAALLVNTLLMGLFALQHSGMARDVVRRVLLRHMPLHVERPLYGALSGISFLVLAWFWRRPPGVLWSLHDVPGAVLRGAALLSAILLAASLLQTGGLRLLGVEALRNAGRETDEAPALQTGGLYAFARHPLLIFTLALFWIWPHVHAGRALFAAGFTLYVAWAVPREERSLRQVFGEAYDAYAARVPRWIPRIPRRTAGA